MAFAMLSAGDIAGAFPMPSAPLALSRKIATASHFGLCMSATDRKIEELKITLPQRPPPAANYDPFVVTGKYVYVSGQLPMMDGRIQFTGKVQLLMHSSSRFAQHKPHRMRVVRRCERMLLRVGSMLPHTPLPAAVELNIASSRSEPI